MSILTPGRPITPRKVLGTYHMITDEQAYRYCCHYSAILRDIYPGHTWRVGMNQDVVYIQALNLNKVKGYKINLADIIDDRQDMMRIGGRVLEMYNQRRGRRDVDAEKELKRNIRGDAEPDV